MGDLAVALIVGIVVAALFFGPCGYGPGGQRVDRDEIVYRCDLATLTDDGLERCIRATLPPCPPPVQCPPPFDGPPLPDVDLEE